VSVLQVGAELQLELQPQWLRKTSTNPAVSPAFHIAVCPLINMCLTAPDGDIQGPMAEYYQMGVSDVEMTELLKQHYDTEKYGLRYFTFHHNRNSSDILVSSVITLRRLRKKWNMLSTRQQKHTEDSIYNHVYEIRKQFPMRGSEGIRKTLRIENGVHATRYENCNIMKSILMHFQGSGWPSSQGHGARGSCTTPSPWIS
jgi:hypothetical protein